MTRTERIKHGVKVLDALEKSLGKPPVAGAAPCSASPERLKHLVGVLRIRLNRITDSCEPNKMWIEARESIEVLRQLEAEIL